MEFLYRLFDLEKEDKEVLFKLYYDVYGNNSAYIKRWSWEYESNPLKKYFKIFVAEDNGKIIGATTRLPFKLKLGHQDYITAFNVNSMVHPQYRRQGIIEKLYHLAMTHFHFVYSKGTTDAMYNALIKMGFSPVEPQTFLSCILSWPKWALWRSGIYKPLPEIRNIGFGENDKFKAIEQFGSEFDEFWEKIVQNYSNIVIKNSHYMNWRYLNNPIKKYKAFYRESGNKIVSLVVLGQYGTTAKIVDLMWDKKEINEPFHTISVIKKKCRKAGFLKLLCWTSLLELRENLKKNSFIDHKETIRFSFCSEDDSFKYLSQADNCYFAEGDGDSEYLGL